MAPYKVVIQGDALDLALDLKRREKDDLVRSLHRLADAPVSDADWIDHSQYPRPIYVRRVGRWLFEFWPDHAAKELRIVSIENLKP